MLMLGLTLFLWVVSGVAMYVLMVLSCIVRKRSVSDEPTSSLSRRGKARLRRRLPVQRSRPQS